MKLSKIQRYTLYCILLEEAETSKAFLRRTGDGLCHLIETVTNMWPTNYYPYLSNSVPFSDIAPELNRYKNMDSIYWFNNWDERIEALKQCIKETHP